MSADTVEPRPMELVGWPVSPLEQAEQLEQLRALEHGLEMAVVRVQYQGQAVDTPEDVARVEQLLGARS